MIASSWRSRRGLPALATVAASVVLLGGGTDAIPTGLAVHDLVVEVVVTGPGEVTVAPSGITCRSTCSVTVGPGTEVALTAVAPPGSILVAWRDACAGQSGDTCLLRPEADTAVTVVFAIAQTTTPGTTTSATTEPATTTGPTTTAATTTVPTATTPRPPPVRPGPLLEDVDRILGRLPIASVAFNTPRTLGRDETGQIELLLSLRESITRLKTQITEAGDRVGARVRITDEMKASLAGSDFDITPITPERQVVSGSSRTEWSWEIEPRRTGRLRLHLTLTGFLEVNGESRERAIRTFDRTLTIRVAWSARVKDFLGGNWQWLWTAVVVPFGLWTIRTRKRRPAAGDSSLD